MNANLSAANLSAKSWRREHSGEGLKISQRHAITHGSIMIIIIGLHESSLRIDHFQHGRFAILVAQSGKPLAFRSQFGRARKPCELIQGSVRFRVK